MNNKTPSIFGKRKLVHSTLNRERPYIFESLSFQSHGYEIDELFAKNFLMLTLMQCVLLH